MSKSGYWYLSCALCCAVGIAGLFVPIEHKRRPQKPEMVEHRATVRQRRIFRFSVIPGGVESGTELRTALLTDDVAARHYAGFQVERIQVIRLSRPRKLYVSYRIENRIYWTRSRVALPKGEPIFTDGKLSARARCGNRLSDTKQLPVLLTQEPNLGDFEQVERPELDLSHWGGGNWPGNADLQPGESQTDSGETAINFHARFGPKLEAFMFPALSTPPGSVGAPSVVPDVPPWYPITHGFPSYAPQLPPSLRIDHGNVPVSDAPEPDTALLMLVAGFLVCASAAIRKRYRNWHN